jgi:hypothetical protein
MRLRSLRDIPARMHLHILQDIPAHMRLHILRGIPANPAFLSVLPIHAYDRRKNHTPPRLRNLNIGNAQVGPCSAQAHCRRTAGPCFYYNFYYSFYCNFFPCRTGSADETSSLHYSYSIKTTSFIFGIKFDFPMGLINYMHKI